MKIIIKGADKETADELLRIYKVGTAEGIHSKTFKLFRIALGIKATMYFDNGNLVIEKREEKRGRWSDEVYEYIA